MSELEMVLRHLQQPGYLHTVLNPIPLYSLATGALAVAASLLWGNRQALVIGLGLVTLACLSAWPVYHFGQKAHMPVFMSLGDPQAQQWLDAHMLRAERWIYLFYFTGIVAVAAIVAQWTFMRSAKSLAIAALIAATASVAVAGWISHAGGQVRHTEFREGPPPGASPEHGHTH